MCVRWDYYDDDVNNKTCKKKTTTEKHSFIVCVRNESESMKVSDCVFLYLCADLVFWFTLLFLRARFYLPAAVLFQMEIVHEMRPNQNNKKKKQGDREAATPTTNTKNNELGQNFLLFLRVFFFFVLFPRHFMLVLCVSVWKSTNHIVHYNHWKE